MATKGLGIDFDDKVEFEEYEKVCEELKQLKILLEEKESEIQALKNTVSFSEEQK